MLRHLNIVGLCVIMTLVLTSGCRSPSQPNNDVTRTTVLHLLKQHGLENRTVLIQAGMFGCDLSARGLREMTDMHKHKTIPDLAYLRLEGSGETTNIKAPFPVHADLGTRIATQLQATAIPSYVLVDTFGRIRYLGKFPPNRLADWVDLIAAETTDPGPSAPRFGTTELDIPALLAATSLPRLDGSTANRLCGRARRAPRVC